MSIVPSREEALFSDALAQPPAERGAFLAKACGEDGWRSSPRTRERRAGGG